jgi:hypothetical protein
MTLEGEELGPSGEWSAPEPGPLAEEAEEGTTASPGAKPLGLEDLVFDIAPEAPKER